MIDKLSLLALSVSSNIPTEETPPPLSTLQIALIVIAAVLVVVGICLIACRKRIKAASEAKKAKKADEVRQAELDRLHKIKKQNKRK